MPGEAPTARADELRAQHRRLPVARHWSLALHWLARWWRPPRPARHEALPRPQPGQVAVAFGGHATALVRYAGLDVVVDPMLGRWLGGIRRAQEPGLAPGDLDQVGLVLITHRHRDHLHVPTLEKLPRSATVVVPPGGAADVSALGFARVVELAVGGDVEMRGVQIAATPMSHGDAARARGLSYVIRGDGPSVFVCGDGAYFSGFAEIGARFAPDLALLPIGGFVPASFRARHMSPLDALYAFEDLRARLLVPIHHGAFALSYEKLGEPARWLGQLVKQRGLEAHVRILEPGESELFAPPRALRAPSPGPEPAPEPARAPAAAGGAAEPAVLGEPEAVPEPIPSPMTPVPLAPPPPADPEPPADAEPADPAAPEPIADDPMREPDSDPSAEAATTPRMPSALGALLREIATEASGSIQVALDLDGDDPAAAPAPAALAPAEPASPGDADSAPTNPLSRPVRVLPLAP